MKTSVASVEHLFPALGMSVFVHLLLIWFVSSQAVFQQKVSERMVVLIQGTLSNTADAHEAASTPAALQPPQVREAAKHMVTSQQEHAAIQHDVAPLSAPTSTQPVADHVPSTATARSAESGVQTNATAPGSGVGAIRMADYDACPPPTYPLVAKRRNEQGAVNLKVKVLSNGMPGDVEIVRSSGSQSLDRAALQAVAACRFRPQRAGTDVVESWVMVPMVFRLETP